VDARTHVERRRRQLGGRAIGGEPDERAPTGFGRTALDPVDVVAIHPRLGESDHLADEVIDPDRRDPAPGWGDDRSRWIDRRGKVAQVPCCQEEMYSACSAVIASSSIPRAASLSRATSASIASGTT
jgi:hypothetical protein